MEQKILAFVKESGFTKAAKHGSRAAENARNYKESRDLKR